MATFKLSDKARRKAARRRGRPRRFRATMAGRNRRAAQRQPGSIGFTAGSTRRARVGGCGVGAVVAEPLKRYDAAPMPMAMEPDYGVPATGSPGFSGGSTKRRIVGERRVPPPTRPAGRFGGRGYMGYRYPGSHRIVTVGGQLVDIGPAKCVPCSEKARAARG